MGNILTLAYKSHLLASLIPIQYEDTIDNLNDLNKSGLPIILIKGNALTDYFRRKTNIFKKAILVHVDPHNPPQWIFTMYVKGKFSCKAHLIQHKF